MKRPNLVNPQNWTPFRSIPIANDFLPQLPQLPEPNPVPVVEIPRPISRRELVQRNSFYLNLVCLLIVIGIGYFLYSIYLERKIFSDYLNYIRNTEQEHYPGFL
jgi:hypothetical protein